MNKRASLKLRDISWSMQRFAFLLCFVLPALFQAMRTILKHSVDCSTKTHAVSSSRRFVRSCRLFAGGSEGGLRGANAAKKTERKCRRGGSITGCKRPETEGPTHAKATWGVGCKIKWADKIQCPKELCFRLGHLHDVIFGVQFWDAIVWIVVCFFNTAILQFD